MNNAAYIWILGAGKVESQNNYKENSHSGWKDFI
jgi:hypothetical protein